MKMNQKLGIMIYIEAAALLSVLALIAYLDGSQVQNYRLWEVFPALMASIITTYGLKEMSRLT
ncbi:hypothetical protein [Candidatus Nanohalobium constans]|uniref:Uncharacterized protein n=1 Tax=Candidatus Nanohalobium constans TaxID=2565781 RepID=A0A5Q0UFJ7_9ARCH|nr:hypothetical protein [Candidatus Nanohalobium constans]QGA79960.1 hypothetical protein LC1Nh_0052 [Candidatus Nanohalobium constans]